MATKANIFDGRVVFDDSGEFTLPVQSALPHRFDVVDGVIVEKEKYAGLTDNQVRQQDHEEAAEINAAAIAAWEDLDDEMKAKLPRPLELPPLTLPEE